MLSKFICFTVWLIISIALVSCALVSEEKTTIGVNKAEMQQDTVEREELPPEIAPPAAEGQNTVYINNKKLTSEQIEELTTVYGFPPKPGKYWYDSSSGSYGVWQGPSLGVIFPGHDFADLPADASNGDTGVFINGRELPEADVLFLEWILLVSRVQGRYWQDALGNIGYEGDPNPLVNLYAAYQQRAQLGSSYSSGGASDNYWAGNFGSYGNEQNGFGYVMVDGTSVTYGG